MLSKVSKSKILPFIFVLSCSFSAIAAPTFQFFSSWDDAKNYYEGTLSPLLSGIDGDDAIKVVPKSNGQYERIERILADLTVAFSKNFSELDSLSRPPFVLILDDEEENAMAPTEPGSNEKPYLFVIYKGLLKLSDLQLEGIIAHELVHLFLQDRINGRDVPPYKYYIRKAGAIAFGSKIESDVALEENLTRLNELISDVGPFSNIELGGIPISNDQSELTDYKWIEFLMENYKAKAECSSAKKIKRLLASLVANALDETSNRLILMDDAAKFDLQFAATEFEGYLRACLAGIRISYDELLMQTYSLPQELLEKMKGSMTQKEEAEYEKAVRRFREKEAIVAILDSTRESREEMRKIESELDIQDARIFTHEDHADEVAVYVLMQMGLDSEGLNTFLIRGNEHSCTGIVEPTYGPLEDEHHENCWRVYRNRKYREYLASLPQVERDAIYKKTNMGFPGRYTGRGQHGLVPRISRKL